MYIVYECLHESCISHLLLFSLLEQSGHFSQSVKIHLDGRHWFTTLTKRTTLTTGPAAPLTRRGDSPHQLLTSRGRPA